MAGDSMKISPEDVIRAIPSQPQMMSWFFDHVEVVDNETQERSRRVILSLLTPMGVLKFWFTADGIKRFGARCMSESAEAAKPLPPQLQVAQAIPQDQASSVEDQESIVRKIIEGKGKA